MFDSLIVAVNAIFPICIMIGIGYMLKKVGMLSRTTLKEMNKVVFKILIPLSLMQSMINTDLSELNSISFITFTIGRNSIRYFIPTTSLTREVLFHNITIINK